MAPSVHQLPYIAQDVDATATSDTGGGRTSTGAGGGATGAATGGRVALRCWNTLAGLTASFTSSAASCCSAANRSGATWTVECMQHLSQNAPRWMPQRLPSWLRP
jgi:hypothetical protein